MARAVVLDTDIGTDVDAWMGIPVATGVHTEPYGGFDWSGLNRVTSGTGGS